MGHNCVGMNSYVVQHLMFYLNQAGMCLTIIIVEWIGHRFLFAAAPDSLMFHEFPAIGNAVFVIFVGVTLMTPSSAFSVLLFILGVTKLGYPDILLQCWTVWDIKLREDGDEADAEEVGQDRVTIHRCG